MNQRKDIFDCLATVEFVPLGKHAKSFVPFLLATELMLNSIEQCRPWWRSPRAARRTRTRAATPARDQPPDSFEENPASGEGRSKSEEVKK